MNEPTPQIALCYYNTPRAAHEGVREKTAAGWSLFSMTETPGECKAVFTRNPPSP